MLTRMRVPGLMMAALLTVVILSATLSYKSEAQLETGRDGPATTDSELHLLLQARITRSDSSRQPESTSSKPEYPTRSAVPLALTGNIAFETDRASSFDVYAKDAHGSSPAVPLVTSPGDDFTPVWSPDGTQMVFASDRDGDFDIYLRTASGEERSLTHNTSDDAHPSWSPAGDRIIFASNRGGSYFQIYTMRTDGTDVRQVGVVPDNNAVYPRYSPDGSRIAFMRASITAPLCEWNWDVWVMDADGGNQQRVTTFLGGDLYPNWTPDGTEIVYASCRNFLDFDLYAVNPDTGTESQINSWFLSNEWGAIYSPDVEHIAFNTDFDGNIEIYIGPSAGGTVSNFTQNSADDLAASWGSQDAPTPTPTPPGPTPTPTPPPSLRPPTFWEHLIVDQAKYEDNGAKDEGFTWTHSAVTFDSQGNPQCDQECLAEMWLSYQESINEPLTVPIPITRYYGATEGNQLAETVRTNVIQSAKIGILVWDIDPLEEVSLSINGHTLSGHLSGRDGEWHYYMSDIPVEYLQFPSAPGSPSNPTDPSDEPGQPIPVANEIAVEFDPQDKALIAGVRLIIKGVRPVVLIPGFGADASGYNWGEVQRTLTETYGLGVERPCDYGWYFEAWLPGFLPEEHHRRCFERVELLVANTGTLWQNGWALRWTVDEVKTRYGVEKVNLVGHSKGGLFSREYTSGPYSQRDVENLISISTPHRGAFPMDVALGWKDLPDPCGSGFPGWLCRLGRAGVEAANDLIMTLKFKKTDDAGKEISEEWVDERRESFNERRPPIEGVAYHSIIATAGMEAPRYELDVDEHGTMVKMKDPPGFGLLPGLYSAAYTSQYFADESPNRGEGDIGILAPSQKMGNISDGYAAAERNCFVIRANHEQSSQEQATANAVAKSLGLEVPLEGISDCEDSLADDLPESHSWLWEIQSTAAVTEPSHLLGFAGTITYGVSAEIPFAVDGSDLSIAGLWIGDGSLSLIVLAPDSTEYTTTVTGTIDLGFPAPVDIADPIKGSWTARISAPPSGSASEDIQWKLYVSQRSPLSFGVDTVSPEYPFGSSVTLRGYPITGTVPILGANIQAEVRSQTGITEMITLLDDGLHGDGAANDGVYGAQLVPSEAGYYDVSSVLTGTLPFGIPYMRQDSMHFIMLPSGAQLSNTYSDAGIDEGGDGFFDRLRVQVGVTLNQDGEYELIGTLSTLDGIELGTATAAISDTAGSNVTANLDFDASVLVNRPTDGPVGLSELVLLDRSVELRADYRQDAYTTQSYSRLDFSGWEVRRAGSLSDQGVDTDGNGKFEYLEVQVPLEVRRAGTYTATAVLEMGLGDAIIGHEAVFSVASDFGVATASIHFDGPTVYASAADGPYTVTNMRVEGPLGLAWMKHMIGQTTSYSYLDFEAGVRRLYLPLILRSR